MDQKSKLSRKQLAEMVQEVGRVEHAKEQERRRCILIFFQMINFLT